MRCSQSIQKLIILFFLSLNLIYAQDCLSLNPSGYGDCNENLGYAWTGSNCVLVYGCDMGQDFDLFYTTYEECDIECNNPPSLGDLNNDFIIL